MQDKLNKVQALHRKVSKQLFNHLLPVMRVLIASSKFFAMPINPHILFLF